MFGVGFPSRTPIVPTDYVSGQFVNNLTIPCALKTATAANCSDLDAASTASKRAHYEVFPSAIREALKTW